MQWQSAEGDQRVEDFFEVPAVVVATQAQAQATVNQAGFAALGDTGVQVSAPVGANLSAEVLPVNFNPPAEYGNIWWCSLLKLDGLPPDTTAEVIMPLRRSLAPFTALQLFQQQADGSWEALAGQGVVTADGQYVIYTHPGGVVATGGDAEIQPEAVPASDVPVIEEVPSVDNNPPPAENNSQPVPPQDNSANGQPENQVVQPPAENSNLVEVQPTAAPPAQDGGDNTGAPAQPVNATAVVARPTLQAPVVTPIVIGAAPTSVAPTANTITDGSSNTILVGEATRTPQSGGNVALLPTATRGSGISDGTSNTILVGEATRTPQSGGNVALLPTATRGSGISDGTSNTILVGEATRTPQSGGNVALLPTATRGSGISDGTSNTILVGEATRTPQPTGILPFLPTATRGSGISDGTSNTIIISQVTATRGSGISDGSSNTILIGEATRTPTSPALVTAKATQKTDGAVNVLPTLGSATTVPTRSSGVTDGTSNTIIVGQRTPTPVPTARPTAIPIPTVTSTPPPVFSPVIVVNAQPFGAGGARVVIITSTSSSSVVQCQAGQVNCSLLNRRVGTGLR